ATGRPLPSRLLAAKPRSGNRAGFFVARRRSVRRRKVEQRCYASLREFWPDNYADKPIRHSLVSSASNSSDWPRYRLQERHLQFLQRRVVIIVDRLVGNYCDAPIASASAASLLHQW